MKLSIIEQNYNGKIIKTVSTIIFIAAILISILIAIILSKNRVVEKNSFTIDDISLTIRGDFKLYQQYFSFHKDFNSIEMECVVEFDPIILDVKLKLDDKKVLNQIEYLNSVYEEAYTVKNYRRSVKLLKNLTKYKIINKDVLASLYFKIGTILMKQKKYNKAIENFNNSIMYDKENGSTYLRKGSGFTHLSNYIATIGSYRNALRFNCDRNQIAYNDLGCVALKNQNIAKANNSDCLRAFHYFNEAVENDSEEKYEDIYINRGIIFMYFKEFSNALEDFNKAIEINPIHAKAYLNRAQIQIILRNFDSALKDLEKAEELNNNFVEVIEICRKDIEFLSKGA